MQRRKPGIYVFASLILGIPITLLQHAFELLTPAVDFSKIIVRQLAPLLLDLPLHLFPVTFHSVPVHLRFSHGSNVEEPSILAEVPRNAHRLLTKSTMTKG